LVTLDTSALVAILNPRDPDHARCVAIIDAEHGSLVVPVPIMSEISYFVERRHGTAVLTAFLQDIIDGAYVLDCGEHDWSRIQQLIERYADFPLGLADAAVIACAERNGGRVVTLDFRHFGAVAKEGTIQIVT
jgi:predicted nucleic acid-binding protein